MLRTKRLSLLFIISPPAATCHGWRQSPLNYPRPQFEHLLLICIAKMLTPIRACYFDHEGTIGCLQSGQTSRARSFPTVEGNYAFYVYIPVRIPSTTMKELAQFLKKVSSLVPGLNAIDVDIPLSTLWNDDLELEKVVLGRDFYISLARTVSIRKHQIDSLVAMLR